MKHLFVWGILIVLFVGTACEKYPSNPLTEGEDGIQVSVAHTGTDYITIESTVEGIAADKVNILTFEFTVENFRPKAIEFYGRAILDGPPESQEHAIHFRTDTVTYETEDIGVELNTLTWIEPDVDYQIFRHKFPTNDYSPFEGDQGKIIEVTFTEIWAIDENGEKISALINH